MKANSAVSSILGSGWRFPVGIDGCGGISLSSADNDIEESIRIILETAKGERRMRPQFGCRIHELIFAPNSASTIGLARKYVEEALGWWEPRIEILEVDVRSDPGGTAILFISIKYRVKATNDTRSLVYPFYLSA